MPRKPRIDPVLDPAGGITLEYPDGRTDTLPSGQDLPAPPPGMGWQQVIGVGERPTLSYRLAPMGEPAGGGTAPVPAGEPAEPTVPPPRTEMADDGSDAETIEGLTPAGFYQWLSRGAKPPAPSQAAPQGPGAQTPPQAGARGTRSRPPSGGAPQGGAPPSGPPPGGTPPPSGEAPQGPPPPQTPDVQLPLGRPPRPDPSAAKIELIPGVWLNTSPMSMDDVEHFMRTLNVRAADPNIPPPRLFELESRRYIPEDLRLWADAVLDANEKLVEAAVRMNISREQMIERVVTVGLDNYATRLLKRSPDEALNAEEVIGAVFVLLAQHQNTKAAMQAYLTRGTDEAALNFGRHLTLFSTIAAQLRGAVGETGRALNAWQFASAALDLANAYDAAIQSVLAKRGVGVPGAQQAEAARAIGELARNPPSGPPAGPTPDLSIRVGPQDRLVPRAPDTGGAGGPTYDVEGFLREAVNAMGGHEHLRLLALLFASAPPRVATQMAKPGLFTQAREMVMSVFLNSLLSSPPTHIVNFVGSQMYAVMNVAERGLASGTRVVREGIGDLAQWIGMDNSWASKQRIVMLDELGNPKAIEVPREGVSAVEMVAMIEGAKNAFWDAVRAGGRAFAEGRSAWAQNKLDIHGGESPLKFTAERVGIQDGTIGAAMFNLLGLAIEWPARAIIGVDDFTRTLWRKAELYAQVERQVARAMALGAVKTREEAAALRLLLRDQPPEHIDLAADKFASEVAFQAAFTSPTGRALATIMQHPAMKPIVPFYSTPTNVVLATLQRSPFAALMPRFWNDLRAGGAQADLALTRFIVGTGTFFMLAHTVADLLADFESGVMITGGRPEGAAGQTFDRMGLQPYSICVRSEDEWRCHSYMRVEPMSAVIAMAADTAWTMARGPGQLSVDDNVAAIEMAFGAAVGLYDYMLEQPMLQGLSDLADILGLRRGTGGERAVTNIGPALEKVFANFAASMVPNSAMFAAVQRTVDPTVYVTRNPGPFEDLNAKMQADVRLATHVHRMALEQFKARFPGAWDDRVPARNIYGEEVERDQWGLPPLFYPWRSSRGQASEVDELLLRVALRGGYQGMQLPDWSWPQAGVKLTAIQRDYLIAAAASNNRLLSGSNMPLRDEFERIYARYRPRFETLRSMIDATPSGMMREMRLQELWRLENEVARELGEVYARRLDVARESLISRSPIVAKAREALGYSDERLEVEPLARLVEAGRFYYDVTGRAPQTGRDLERVDLLRDAPRSMREMRP